MAQTQCVKVGTSRSRERERGGERKRHHSNGKEGGRQVSRAHQGLYWKNFSNVWKIAIKDEL